MKTISTLSLDRRAFLGLGAAALGSVAFLAGCSAGGTATGSAGAGSAAASGDDTSAVATGTLIVGFDQSYPPYGFVGDDGEYTGFDLDLAQAVADREGWDVQLEAIDWDAKDALLGSGAIKGIGKCPSIARVHSYGCSYVINNNLYNGNCDSGNPYQITPAGTFPRLFRPDSVKRASALAWFADSEQYGGDGAYFLQPHNGSAGILYVDLHAGQTKEGREIGMGAQIGMNQLLHWSYASKPPFKL